MELGVKNKNVNIEIYADKGIQIQGGSTVKILEGTKVSAHMNGTAKADRVGVGDEEIYTQFEMRGQDSTSSIQNENDPKGSTPKPFTLKVYNDVQPDPKKEPSVGVTLEDNIIFDGFLIATASSVNLRDTDITGEPSMKGAVWSDQLVVNGKGEIEQTFKR
ncbi:MAG: hypothetical protein HC796_04210 [Synechococcaceae cyanobacterium RL_1_2]|nr:hypothetical protein [Synechococcaceae cyanobacterium RL_1_2]